MTINRVMSVQEILKKDTKYWKRVDCQEIMNSSETTLDQKKTATEREQAIIRWKESQNQQQPTTQTTTQKTIDTGVDVAKLGLTDEELSVITKSVKQETNILLAKYSIVTKILEKHGLDNPPTIGMFLKLLENCE